ncbi:MAG TPA: SCO family protein [Burkholderiaceae bacterium]|nr:SCO family protein [Burkholderiaceae bacterium]
MLNVKPLRLVCLFTFLVIFMIAQAFGSPRDAGALPADSVYQLPISLTDQDGREFKLSDRRGQPMVVSMFYTSCQFVCPMLIETLRATEAQLSADERSRLTVLLVSFDPKNDTVTVLKRTAGERQVDTKRWALARTDAKSVRKLAAVLGTQYRELSNGDFNHSTSLVLLDADGRIAAKTPRLGDADPAFVTQVHGVLAAH